MKVCKGESKQFRDCWDNFRLIPSSSFVRNVKIIHYDRFLLKLNFLYFQFGLNLIDWSKMSDSINESIGLQSHNQRLVFTIWASRSEFELFSNLIKFTLSNLHRTISKIHNYYQIIAQSLKFPPKKSPISIFKAVNLVECRHIWIDGKVSNIISSLQQLAYETC